MLRRTRFCIVLAVERVYLKLSPYCHRNADVSAATTGPKSKKFIIETAEGHTHLDRSQSRTNVCGVNYCDFCTCTFPESGPSLFSERIYLDRELWQSCVEKATCFFRVCILPEIFGKWYTRPSSLAVGTAETSDEPTAAELPSDTSQTNEEKKYCYCKKTDDGSAQMFGCDSALLPIKNKTHSSREMVLS